MAVVIAVDPDQVPIARPRSLSPNDALIESQAAGNKKRSPYALDRARRDELLDARSQATGHRRDGEYCHTQQEHPATAIQIAH